MSRCTCSPWGSRKGRNLRPPSPAKGGSWNARRFASISPEEPITVGGHALRSHQTQSEAAAVGLAGLPSGSKACEVAVTEHAQQAQCSERSRRTQKAPQQMDAAAVIKVEKFSESLAKNFGVSTSDSAHVVSKSALWEISAMFLRGCWAGSSHKFAHQELQGQ